MSDRTVTAQPLAHRAVIVTGSGCGIGAAIALHLAGLGVDVEGVFTGVDVPVDGGLTAG